MSDPGMSECPAWDEQDDDVCAYLADADGVIRNQIIFSHSMGNQGMHNKPPCIPPRFLMTHDFLVFCCVVLAYALARGTCRLDTTSSAWYSIAGVIPTDDLIGSSGQSLSRVVLLLSAAIRTETC